MAYLRCIPNMVVMAPSSENEARQMLTTAYRYNGPAAVRYPRGAGIGIEPEKELTALPLGKGDIPVSYTHLDVYKRQQLDRLHCLMSRKIKNQDLSVTRNMKPS